MSALTGALYAALIVYLGGWAMDKWIGNFAMLLLLLTLVTFAYWIAEKLWFLPRRRRAVAALEQSDAARRAELRRQGIEHVDGDLDEARARLSAQPWWLDWTAGLFPVIAAVFVLRSFVCEPFKIPSGSMIPTLQVGDLILVNKFDYGLRLPVGGVKIVRNRDPQRGDVMVFHYPLDPRVDYIKRVVGVPGDTVSYLNKQLRVNGQLVEEAPVAKPYYVKENVAFEQEYTENLLGVKHHILINPARQGEIRPIANFDHIENCRYSSEGVVCKVPPGNYFMMGDHRDDSEDSRYWGFVPDANIVGRAFFVWMNFGDLSRIGGFR